MLQEGPRGLNKIILKGAQERGGPRPSSSRSGVDPGFDEGVHEWCIPLKPQASAASKFTPCQASPLTTSTQPSEVPMCSGAL